ncbi:M50 family metallopeptidase [Actinotalea sp. C106]|uniref:M50 family metallopeptidase n=1 Tax=Actinotalea sp. C106 TaxID=2908644 RepID=UPI002028B55B|nr:M50 family metallopeptidase [Actinotalea sp. C106]
MLAEIWDRILTTQPLPSTGAVLATAAVALALIMVPGLWPLTRHAVTVAHEGGHAIAAVLTGRRLTGIRLHSDTSGLTVSRGRPRGPGMVLTLLAGYTAPALIGLGAAAMLSRGLAVALLWAVLLLLALLLLQIRNLFGLWVVLVCGVGVFAVTWWAEPRLQSAVAYALTFFLLLAAPRTVLELAVSRRRGRARGSDADQLAGLTRVPGALWVLVFAVVTLGSLALGVAWLLPEVLDRVGA